MQYKTVIVSDVFKGYGSPQVDYLKKSIGDNDKDNNVLIIRPSLAGDQILTEESEWHIATTSHPHDFAGRIEYSKKAAAVVEQLNPEVLIVVNPYTLLILLSLDHQKYKIIYYGLEPIKDYPDLNVVIDFKKIKEINFEILVYPEINRYKTEYELFSTKPTVMEVRNVPLASVNSGKNNFNKLLIEKEFDFIYFGTLDPRVISKEALREIHEKYKLIVFGHKNEYEMLDLNLDYRGHQNQEFINDYLLRSRFSLSLWSPKSIGTTFASPNKLFISISKGIPIVSFTSPQIASINLNHNIGFITKDFDHASLMKQAKLAMELGNQELLLKYSEHLHSLHYEIMNWEKESEKLVSLING
jgi:hypothetical protein